MAWGDDWLKNGLPTFTGLKDKSLARKLIDHLGGPEGFRKVERVLPDGSIVRVTLRGEMSPRVDYVPAKKEVIFADYIEVAYASRTIASSNYDPIKWMTQTPLEGDKNLKVRIISKRESYDIWWDDNAVFWPIESFYSSDGALKLTMVRHIKSATVTIDGVDQTATFAYSSTSSYYPDHTVEGPLGIYYRVKPAKLVTMQILGSTKTLLFKEPPATLTYDGSLTEGVNPFDQLVTMGNPWHGVYSEQGLTTPDGTLHTEFAPPTQPNYVQYLNFGLPPAPAPSPKELAAGMSWYNDLVLPGIYRQYSTSPSGVFSHNSYWIHRDAAGKIRKLEVWVDDALKTINILESSFTAGTTYYVTDLSYVSAAPSGWYEINGPVFDQPIQTSGGWTLTYSIDGTKCCFRYYRGCLDIGIEFVASGGTLEVPLAVAATVVQGVADTFMHSKVIVGEDTNAVPSHYEKDLSMTYPLDIQYDRNGDLYLVTCENFVHILTDKAYGSLPVEYTTTTESESSLNVTIAGVPHTLSHTKQTTNVKHTRRPLVTQGPVGDPVPECGYWINPIYPRYDREQNVSADPYWAEWYAEPWVDPGPAGVYTAEPYRNYRWLAYVGIHMVLDASNTVVAAYAYGEPVPALIGHTYSGYTQAAYSTAYNPRTGEVAFGPYAGFI